MTTATLGIALRLARKNAGLTLREASLTTGVSKSHLSGIENDDSIPGLLIAARLTKLYGIGLDSLVAASGALAANAEVPAAITDEAASE